MTSMTGNTGMIKRGSVTGEKIPSGYKKGSIANFTPEAMELYKSLFQHLSPDSRLARLAGGDEEMFNQIEAPAFRNFQGLQGQLASRFSQGGGGQGALSSRHSSGFQNTASAAASNFAQDLQSQRQQLMRQAIQDLMGLSGDLLQQRPYEQFLVPKKENRTAELIGKLAGAIPGLISSFAGGGSPGSAIKGALSIFGG